MARVTLLRLEKGVRVWRGVAVHEARRPRGGNMRRARATKAYPYGNDCTDTPLLHVARMRRTTSQREGHGIAGGYGTILQVKLLTNW